MAGDSRCRRCGQTLYDPVSVALGYGPECAARVGVSPADLLPQRCSCCTHTQGALILLYGLVGPVRAFTRHDGSRGWIDLGTGEVVDTRGDRWDPLAGAGAPLAAS